MLMIILAWRWTHLRISPCPTISAYAKTIPQGHCWKLYHKMKVSCCLQTTSSVKGFNLWLYKWRLFVSAKCRFQLSTYHSTVCRCWWYAYMQVVFSSVGESKFCIHFLFTVVLRWELSEAIKCGIGFWPGGRWTCGSEWHMLTSSHLAWGKLKERDCFWVDIVIIAISGLLYN